MLIFTLRAGVRESENFYYKKIYTFPINSKNIDSEKFFFSKNYPLNIDFINFLPIFASRIRLYF